jgi:heme exporter protein A
MCFEAGEALMKVIAEMLSATRGGRVVFAQVSFAIAGGEALVLTGPNGAGKTTLIRIIAGLLKPAGGRIRLDGGQPERTPSEECHYVGHLNGVKASLTVGENAAFWTSYLGGEPERVERALATFGLAAVRDIPAAYLSTGQRRRLGLARVLLAERPIWLLDEPTAALDHAAQQMLTGAVDAHLAGGGLVVAATHAPLGFSCSRELPLGSAALAA